MNGKEFKTSRRRALKIISAAIIGLVAFLMARFTQAFVPAKRRQRIKLKSSDLQVEPEVFVLHSGAKIEVLSRTCPHLGCKVKFDSAMQRFICPCHGSQFSLDGRYLKGPAKKDLKRLSFKKVDQPATIMVTL